LTPTFETAAGLYLFFSPWLLLLLGTVNLPFLMDAFRAFRMDVATRRNHALEHATILLLEQSCGRRFAGRSSWNGFHVIGQHRQQRSEPHSIACAMSFKSGQRLSYISTRCGSSVVTVLGLGLGILLLTALVGATRSPFERH
jgi:hypothetical protein